MENLFNKVLNLEQACAYLGYKRSYVYRLASEGIIPSNKPNGKRLFFDRDRLEHWMLSGSKEVNPSKKQSTTTNTPTHAE